MIIGQCNWDHPGVDPYSGAPAAAIMAFAEIPPEVRRELIERVQRRDYDDVVIVDRDSIRGKRAYSPEIRNMHFGSRGKLCASVTRSNWSPSHVESGMVFCSGPYCIVRFSVCNNWSMLTQEDAHGLTQHADWENIGGLPLSAPLYPIRMDTPPAAGSAPPVDEDETGVARPLSFDRVGLGGGYVAAPVVIVPAVIVPAVIAPVVIAPVPEPAASALMLLGLAALAAWKRINHRS